MSPLPSPVLRRFVLAGLSLGALLATAPLHAYTFIGGAWKSGNISLRLQLDATAPASVALPLTDGSTSWNAVAQSAINEWNTSMSRTQLTYVANATGTAEMYDGINSILFSTTIYGDAFDSNTLGVTLVDHYDDQGMPTVQINETDLILNKNKTWNSFRGSVSSSLMDARRVLLHELGHVIGLDHPDEGGQNVNAIMNSHVGSLTSLQDDDKGGAAYLYPTTLTTPVITTPPASQSGAVGGSANLSFALNGSTSVPATSVLLDYRWYFKAAGTSTWEYLFTVHSPTLSFGSLQLMDAGSYYVEVMTPDAKVDTKTAPAVLTVNPVATSANSALTNLSTRGIAGSGDSTMQVGFVVKGTKNKQILLRVIGPTLSIWDVTGVMADPQLRLINRQTGATLALSTGAAWDADSANAAAIIEANGRTGAFALPAGSRDAVILTTVAPGEYSALATSVTGATGVVMFEAYDADPRPLDPTSRLANLSTRGYVSTGDKMMFAGFNVDGPGPKQFLIRVVGPTISHAPFNVTGTLYDPMLKLYRNPGSVLLRETDDWDTPSATQPTLKAAFSSTSAFGLNETDSRRESVMLVTLEPGLYSAEARGNDNDGTSSPSGNVLLEIYEMP